jgi:hypothetical protein
MTKIDPVTKRAVTKRMHNKGRQPRHVLTVVGKVKVVRRWYSGSSAGSVVPADQVIDPNMATVTVGVREMACRLNNDGTSFDTTAENLERVALIKISGEQLRQTVLAEGRAVLAAQQSNTVPPAFQASKCVVDPTATKKITRIYTGTDGVMVPLVTEAEKIKRRTKVCEKRRLASRKRSPLPPRKPGANLPFKEYKVIVFYDEHGKYWHETFSRRTRTNIGVLIRRDARRLGFSLADEKIANVDGATWIKNQLEERPEQLPLDGLGLDFYHLSENIHRCRRGVFGNDPAGLKWAEELLHLLKHEGYEPAHAKIFSWRQAIRSPNKKEFANKLLNYITDRRDMINYPEFQKKGWQIGSGPTESRCKTTTQRIKGRGRRWDRPNAEEVAALTTLKDSGEWVAYWRTLSPNTI